MRNGAKNDIYSMIFQKFNGPDMFYWIRHCVLEACALLSALLVVYVSSIVLYMYYIMREAH